MNHKQAGQRGGKETFNRKGKEHFIKLNILAQESRKRTSEKINETLEIVKRIEKIISKK